MIDFKFHQNKPKRMDKIVSFRLTDYEFQKLNEFCECEEIRKSDIVRMMIGWIFDDWPKLPHTGVTMQ